MNFVTNATTISRVIIMEDDFIHYMILSPLILDCLNYGLSITDFLHW